MLRKLIKYDFKAMGRVLLPLFGAMILTGLISVLSFKIQPSFFEGNFNILKFMSVLSMILYICLIIASIVLSYVVSITGFKRSLLGSEGYLMNTLPVGVWKKIFSKVFVAVTFQVLSVVVAMFSGFLFFFVSQPSDFIFQIFDIMKQAFMHQETLTIIGYMFEGLFIAILSLVGSNLMIYASMCVGHSANSGKVVKSFGAFIGFYIVSQMINGTLIQIGVSTNMPANFSTEAQLMVLSVTIMQLLYISAYFFIADYFLKNKLNLQ